MDMIHWEAHSQALKKNFVRRTFLIKLLRNKFPAGRTIADYKDATYDHQCPSCCQEEYEDGTHFLHCSHPNSIK
jgi:hypothetical protein